MYVVLMLSVIMSFFYYFLNIVLFHHDFHNDICDKHWTGPFKLTWLKGYIYNPSYYHNQIGSIHLSHCCHIFRGCVSEMVVLPYSVIYYIYISREHWDLVSIICVHSIDVQSMVFANDRMHYGLQVVFVCLQIAPYHYHNYTDSS